MTILPGPLAPAGVEQHRGSERQRIREAAEAFESLLLENLIHSMKEGQLNKGFFGGGTGTAIYEGLMERNLAEHLSRRSPLGLADVLEARWSQRLEASDDSEAVRREIEIGRGLASYRDALDGVVEAIGVGLSDTISPGDRPPGLKKPNE